MIKRFRSERFIFAIRTSSNHSKILQIIFSKQDGSIYVNFPYFLNSKGLASIATKRGGIISSNHVDLIEGGKVTSQLVKYTHHPDGQTHFSQDSKVLTVIRKQSVRLDQPDIHIFTVQLQGLHGFKKVEDRDLGLLNEQKTLLNLESVYSQSVAFKIVGRWLSNKQLEENVIGHVEGPKIIGKMPNGKTQEGFLISSPMSYPLSDHILLVTCEWIPRLSKDSTALTFIGGFDPLEVINNYMVDTKFLALAYPITNYEELKERIGSIDFVRSPNKK